jgi:hypothetical protein
MLHRCEHFPHTNHTRPSTTDTNNTVIESHAGQRWRSEPAGRSGLDTAPSLQSVDTESVASRHAPSGVVLAQRQPISRSGEHVRACRRRSSALLSFGFAAATARWRRVFRGPPCRQLFPASWKGDRYIAILGEVGCAPITRRAERRGGVRPPQTSGRASVVHGLWRGQHLGRRTHATLSVHRVSSVRVPLERPQARA